jgi:hypothetical protein
MGAVSAVSLETRPQPGSFFSRLDEDLMKEHVPDWAHVSLSFDKNLVAKKVLLPHSVSLLRLYGEGAKPTGRYYFCCLETKLNQFTLTRHQWTDASGLATPPENLMSQLAIVTVPPFTPLYVGGVADAFGKPGGNVQIFIPRVSNFPSDDYQLRATGKSASDIKVVLDDETILWFRAP